MDEIRLANKDDGPIAHKVIDPKLTGILKDLIMKHWPNNHMDYFPAPQPVSLERRDLYKLCEYEYLVCVKSDGMRFIMVCYDSNTYMVDRAFKFYSVGQSFDIPSDYVIGNFFIIDGELVKNKNLAWTYVVHDCISYYNQDCTAMYFPIRYANVHKLVNENWIADKSDFIISEKKFYETDKLEELNQLIMSGSLDHSIDGLIFTPKNKRIGTQTQYDLFKWKPRELHTFDFRITINNEGVTAYGNKDSVLTPYASASRNSQDEIIFINGIKTNCPEFINGNIVECKYNENVDMFEPIKIRSDKTHPNSIKTVKKTMCNIRENITINELIELFSTNVHS